MYFFLFCFFGRVDTCDIRVFCCCFGFLDACDIRVFSFACWGFADAQIQVYCYWFIGSIFETADEHSRAVGYYKCVQSLGYSIGFYLIPPSRLSPILQLVVSSSIFYIGTCLAFMQLPSWYREEIMRTKRGSPKKLCKDNIPETYLFLKPLR